MFNELRGEGVPEKRGGGSGESIEKLLNDLAMAFGGHSQYTVKDVGRAIAGHINNAGWPAKGSKKYAIVAASILEDRWKDGNEDLYAKLIHESCADAIAQTDPLLAACILLNGDKG